jgi:TonB-linked SusC/RagA family outer membrane protein
MRERYLTNGLTLFILALFLAAATSAQTPGHVSGKVSDITNAPLARVTVTVKNKPGVTVATDTTGSFQINATRGDVLQFSYVGYQTEEMKVGSDNVINVTMASAGGSLNEVVVIGYGTLRRRDLTGAVANIKGEDLKTQGVADVTRTLQGRLPGVSVESAGGNPGAGTRILIRGVGSLGNASPLYIVDGVQVSNIGNLSSVDIESIDVLKDASAAAIYGSRAANGVVIVTTKLGKGGPPQVQFNANVGVQKLSKKLDLLNAREWANVSNAAHDAAGLARLTIAANPESLGEGTDWQDAVYRNALIQQYALGVSGGSANGKYNISGGYTDQQGIIDVTGYKRYNIRVKSETTKGRLKFGETIFLSREKERRMAGGWGGQGGNPAGSAAKMIPVFQIYDSTALGGYAGAYGPVVNVANPIAQLNLEDITYEETNILANAFAEVTILPSLKYKFNLGYTNMFGSNYDYYNRHQVGTLFSHPTNDLTEEKSQNVLVLLENTLNYTKDFGKHNIQALAGYTYQTNKYSFWSLGKTDLPDGIAVIDAGAGTATSGGNKTQNSLVSVLGRVIYSYDNRYLLTASFRRDGSSRFGSSNRYGNFPSIAVGWNLNNERFFSSLSNTFSTLKLRGSYGELGNQEIGDYQYSAAIASNINYVAGADQHKWFGAIQTAFSSPNIKWESTKTTNVGLDFGFWQNKLTGSVDYFYKKTSDVLLNVPIPGSAGSVSNPVVNAGTLTNRGVEIGLSFNNKIGDFEYNVYGTFTSVKNEVVELGTGSQQIFGGQPTHHGASTTVTQAGGEVSAFYLIRAEGIFNSQDEINNYAKDGNLVQPNAKPGDIKFLDANGDGQISDADRVFCGSPFPDFEFGFGAEASLANFDLKVYLQGTSGNKIYNGLRQDIEGMNLEFNYSAATLNAWTPENHSDIPRAVINDPNFNDRTSSRFLENGSYLRMKTLQLGYSLPPKAGTALGFTKLRVYLSADNLFMITNYSGYNPDIGRTGTILDRGVDFGHVAYPLAKTLSAGVQVTF